MRIRKETIFSEVISKPIFTRFSKLLLIAGKRLTSQYVLVIDLSQIFLNTETTDETF